MHIVLVHYLEVKVNPFPVALCLSTCAYYSSRDQYFYILPSRMLSHTHIAFMNHWFLSKPLIICVYTTTTTKPLSAKQVWVG
jgi:hypothetical protein